MTKVKTWAGLSGAAWAQFDRIGDWMNHFSLEVVTESQEFYAAIMEEDERNMSDAGAAAWYYAMGASRFMQR